MAEELNEEQTKAKAVDEANKILRLQPILLSIDFDFLKVALKDMTEQHNRRESMAVLNPQPFLHAAQQELEEAKLEQLRLYIAIGDNLKALREAQGNLNKATAGQNSLRQFFDR